MNNSSKPFMNQVFKHLTNIKEVEPSANLYSKTLHKLNRQNIIPMYWVKVAACIGILFISSEVYLFYNQKSSTQDIAAYVSITNNILYNE
jgi:hypothetical protein